MRWLFALVLIAPTAQAGVAFEIELEDKTGDVITQRGGTAPYASADVLKLTSRVVGERVEQRVEMAAKPTAPEDTILLRNWFHNSTNGTFWTMDMEVRGFEPDPAARFHPIMRRGDFANATYVADATYALDNATWVFTFPVSWIDDASCFDPGAFSRHIPARSTGMPEGADALFLTKERRCLTAREPDAPLPPAIPVAGVPSAPAATPTVAPPGSEAPTPGAAALVAIGALALAAWRRRG